MARKKPKPEWRIVQPPPSPELPPLILIVNAISEKDAIRQYNEAASQSNEVFFPFDPTTHMVGKWSAQEALIRYGTRFCACTDGLEEGDCPDKEPWQSK